MRYVLRTVASLSAVSMILSGVPAAAQGDKKPAAPEAPAKTQVEKPITEHKDPKIVSYLFGANIGDTIRHSKIQGLMEIDFDEFTKGMKSTLNGEELKYTPESRREILSAFSKNGQLPKPVLEKLISYLIGGDVGTKMIRGKMMEFDTDSFMEGLKLAVKGEDLKYSKEYRQRVMNAVAQDYRLMERKKSMMDAHGVKSEEEWNVLAAENEKIAKDFLASNARKEGVTSTLSGLQFQVLKGGEGAVPQPTDKVKVAYRGTLMDGTEFINTTEQPTDLRVADQFPGLSEALQMMTVGSKWKLFVPPDLAYANVGERPPIEPGTTLIVEIELKEICKPKVTGTLANEVSQPVAVFFPTQKDGKVKTARVHSKTGKPVGSVRMNEPTGGGQR